MPQIHLRADEGDYAPLVLRPGDPNRARRISERFDPGSVRTVNEHRGLFGFTGEGQTWEKVMTFTRTGETLKRAEEDGSYTYKRCG